MRLSTLFATFGLALMMTLVLPAQTVRVIFVSGEASLQRPDEAALRPIVKGETVIIGTRIVTGADGRVVLTPMPGVKSIVTPNTTLLLESISENRTSETNVTHQAVLDLKQGAVVSDLQKPEGVTYDYSIRTARGLAGARGTTFTVGMNPAGIQTIVVAHGSISINFTDGSTAVLTPGQLSITKTNGDTQSVNNISELPPADQAIAQNWTETTIAAIATALEAGIELDPTALQNALDAARSLGITLSPELQALVDRVLALLAIPSTTNEDLDTETITEVVTETMTEEELLPGFNSFADFVATLNETQQAAFAEIIEVGFPDAPSLEGKLKDGKFARDLVKSIDLYASLNEGERALLVDLGILGDNNVTALGADTVGLRTLINAYYFLDAPPAELLNETDFPKIRENIDPLIGSNFFFPGIGDSSGVTVYNIAFHTEGSSLHVGATRKLIIDNTGYEHDTFVAGYDNESYRTGFVSLHASDLIDLNNTRFGSGVGSILIEAATINLTNITFQAGTNVDLNSTLGKANFGSSKVGYVNFISNVKYDTTVLTNANFGDSVRGTNADATGGHVKIGVLGSPPPPR